MRLENPKPDLTDGVVLLRAWDERDLAVLEEGSRHDCVALIEILPVPFTDARGRAWIEAQRA